MPTNAEMFETIHDWDVWNGADLSAREFDAEGRHSRAEEYRALRNRRAVDPLHVLATTHDLIDSLTAGRWDAITEARLRGATWEQVANAMRRRVDEVQAEYAAMVGWVAEERPQFVDLARYRTALWIST